MENVDWHDQLMWISFTLIGIAGGALIGWMLIRACTIAVRFIQLRDRR